MLAYILECFLVSDITHTQRETAGSFWPLPSLGEREHWFVKIFGRERDHLYSFQI
jgi:hypothetical protein